MYGNCNDGARLMIQRRERGKMSVLIHDRTQKSTIHNNQRICLKLNELTPVNTEINPCALIKHFVQTYWVHSIRISFLFIHNIIYNISVY